MTSIHNDDQIDALIYFCTTALSIFGILFYCFILYDKKRKSEYIFFYEKVLLILQIICSLSIVTDFLIAILILSGTINYFNWPNIIEGNKIACSI